MSSRNVLISGAGIAGPALAFWLTRYGFKVTVVERASGLRPGGFAVDFRGTATQVLARMGLTEAVQRHETRTGAIVMVDANGKTTARLPDGFTSGDIEILRGDLARILYDATSDHAIYRFDDSIVQLVQDDEGVHVTFASGDASRFDFVIGADGLHSTTRELAFPMETKARHDMGYYIGIYTVPDYLALGDEGRFHTQRGRRVGYFGSKVDGQAKASFYLSSRHVPKASADPLQRDIAAQKALLRNTFADMGWETQRLLGYLDEAPDFYFDSLSQIRMGPWSSGRVVLLGDAAACASPLAGMGTSIAMTGAYVLASELSRAGDDYAAAFHRYEATLRPFVAQAQKMATDSVAWFIPQGRLRLWLSGKIWSWMSPTTLRELMVDQPNRVASSVVLADYAA